MIRESSRRASMHGVCALVAVAVGLGWCPELYAQDGAASTQGTETIAARDGENAFQRVSLEFTDADVRVDLVASRASGDARVRTEPGFVRVWFHEMTGWSSLDLEGDGGAIRSIRTRQGAGDSNVVILRVGDGRRVPEAHVRVIQEGTLTSILIARELLPAARGLASRVGSVEAPVAATVPQPEAASPQETPSPSELAHERRADRSLDQTSRHMAEPALADAHRGPSSWALLGVTLALALALGAVRLYRARRSSHGPEASIRIVAATRLSAKQQLVVVRALGQDHLLAVEPGRTERLFSTLTPSATAASEEPLLELRLSREPGPSASPQSFAPSIAPSSPLAEPALASPKAIGTAPTLLGRTLAAVGLAPRASAPPDGAGPSLVALGAPLGNTAFARELARIVDPPTEAPPAPAITGSGSGSAVAGLVRLRAQAQAGRP